MGKGLLDPYRDAIVSLLQKQLMGALIAAAPWVGLPVINYFVAGIISLFIDFALDKTILGINLAYGMGETYFDVQHFKNALKEYEEVKRLPDEDPEKKKLLQEREDAIVKAGYDLIDLNMRRL